MTRAGVVLATMVVFIAGVSARQAPEPAVRVIEPAADATITGRTGFVATVTPADARVRYVAFFVDGQQVCRVTAQPFTCSADVGDGREARSVRVVAELADGRRLVTTVRTSGPDPSLLVFSTGVDAITVPVRVRDGRGRAVTGLGADAFRIFEDGVPQTVTHLMTTGSPVSVLLALDMSASMQPLMSDLKRAAEVFLDGVERQSSVAVAAFNNGLFVLARPGADPAARRAALGRLRPWGTTALHDSLIRAADLLKTQPAPRAIVAFTDGQDVASLASIEAVRSAVLAEDTTLYLLVRADEPRDESPEAALARLAESTGGAAWFTSRMSGLADRFKAVVSDLSTRYVLSYTPIKPLGDGAWREIRVEVVGASRDYNIQARQGYFAARRGGAVGR